VKLRRLVKKEPGLEARILLIADLGIRRDRLLESPVLDLEALRRLAQDYESAGLECAAADIRRRVKWYETVRRDLSRSPVKAR
jgi:hypothetical protein